MKKEGRTRNLEKSRQEILDVAFLEILAHGFQGVSVDDIVRQTSLTKGAFYHQFPTKLALGYALVDEVIRPMIIERWIRPLDNYQDPLTGILELLKLHIGKSPLEQLKLGCPLNNLVQEMSPIDDEFHAHLKVSLDLWINEMQKHLKRAQQEGFLKKDVNPKQLATFIVMTHEGFYGLIKGLQDKRIFNTLLNSLEGYFKTLRCD